MVTNIRRADVPENKGRVALELKGEEKDNEEGIARVTSKGEVIKGELVKTEYAIRVLEGER